MNKEIEIKMRASWHTLNTSLTDPYWFFSVQPAAHSLTFLRRKLSQILYPWMYTSIVVIPNEQHDLISTKTRPFQYCSYCHRGKSTWWICLSLWGKKPVSSYNESIPWQEDSQRLQHDWGASLGILKSKAYPKNTVPLKKLFVVYHLSNHRWYVPQ